MEENLYDADFYGWTSQQARLLRPGQIASPDIANIDEEIETSGCSEALAPKACY